METSFGPVGQHEIYSRLVLDKADALAADGIYECEASSTIAPGGGIDQSTGVPAREQSSSGSSVPSMSVERLRRLFGLIVNGKCDD